MAEIYVTKRQLRLLWHQAQRVGFSKAGLRTMLKLVGLNPTTMTVEQYDTVRMYVNAINARKFR